MAKHTGFMEYARQVPERRPVEERVKDWFEIYKPFPIENVRTQGARCMDCGVPFCHTGCPLNNIIPDWNDLVYRDRWKDAIRVLHSTNNFPEFTGRICPAPCEAACTLNIDDNPVTIKSIEAAIIDRAWKEGWVVPQPAAKRTGKKVAVVGAGPAGLACAQQLARAGHAVTVFEKNQKAGGLLRYGIPDFKMEKLPIDRRVAQMEAEGVTFRTGVHIGKDMPAAQLLKDFDAVVLSGGAEQARELTVPGRELDGIHFAMPYLIQQNRRVADLPVEGPEITAKGKRVEILGGGDTSADCLGNALREGAVEVHKIAHGPTPPGEREPLKTWPEWPVVMRTYAAHQEGGQREWQFVTDGFEGRDGRVTHLVGHRVEFPGFAETGVRAPVPAKGGEVVLEVDLVLLAIGFTGTEEDEVYAQSGAAIGERGTVRVDAGFATSAPGVYACGDAVRGADLVVTAIADGRRCAAAVHAAISV